MELLQHLGATYTQCFHSRAVPEGARNRHGQKGRFQGDAQVQKSSVAVSAGLELEPATCPDNWQGKVGQTYHKMAHLDVDFGANSRQTVCCNVSAAGAMP